MCGGGCGEPRSKQLQLLSQRSMLGLLGCLLLGGLAVSCRCPFTQPARWLGANASFREMELLSIMARS